MNWTVLGIEATKDKKAITKAYRGRLVQVNPEDKPEEFKALRAAYEEALKLADQETETPVRDESPVGIWMEKVRALYDDFAARIRPENWKALLADEVCIALDKRPAAEDALLKFLMKDFYVPQSVWQLFDETFGLAERRTELYENYSREFVDYAVMNGIRHPAVLPYELFVPGENAKDCDEYRRLYHEANQGTLSEMAPVLEQLEALSEWHPYGQALTHRLEIENGQVEKGREGYRRLVERYPQDTTLLMGWAAQCINSGDWSEGESLCRRVLDIQPEHWQAKWVLSQCTAKLGRLDEAKSLVLELVYAAGGDYKQVTQLMNTVRELNEGLIKEKEAALRENPDDFDSAIKLAWSYLQNDREEDALKICQAIPEDYEDQFAYHQLYAKVNYACKQYVQSLEQVHLVQDIIVALEPDGTKETERRINKLPEFLQIEGSCLLQMGRNAEAVEKFEQAAELAPEDAEVLTEMIHLLISQRRYERAVDVSEKLTRLRPDSYHGFLLLALGMYKLRRDRDALEAVNRALELEGSDLAVYLMRMKIFLRNGVWSEVRNILDFLRQNGIDNEITMAWCEAQMMEFETKDKEKALSMYLTIAQRLENGEEFEEAPGIYYRITALTEEKKDVKNEEDCEELMAILDKGLVHDPENFDCIEYKAWLLKQMKRNEEALTLYHKLEAVPRYNLWVEQQLAELYYRDLKENAGESLRYYQMLLKDEETPHRHFYAGTCKRYLKDYEGAEKHFLRELELDADDLDGYNGLCIIYEAMGRCGEELELAEKMIAIARTREGNQNKYFSRKIHILRRLGRPMDALSVIYEMTKRYGYEKAEKERYEICCQFRLWDEALMVVRQWKKKDKKSALAAETEVYLFRGEIEKARVILAKSEKKLEKAEYESLKRKLAELDGDAEYPKKIWAERAAGKERNTRELMNLARVCQWSGDIGKAKEYAAEALDKLDKVLEKNETWEPLYRGRRSMVLAILGRIEEARAEIERMRQLPLCVGCYYGGCKDAAIFEAFIEEISGNCEKALELNIAGEKQWPDDLDFAVAIRRLRRKGF